MTPTESVVDRDVFSYSDVSSYLRCPRTLYYKLQDVEQSDSPASAWGRVVHRLHEYIVTESCGPADIAEALEALEDLSANEDLDPMHDETIQKRVRKHREEGVPWLLQQMQHREHLAQEIHLSAEVPGLPGITLSGHPDSFYRQGEALFLGDLKTGRNKPRDVRSDLQLNIYAWLSEAGAGVRPDQIEVTHLNSCEVFVSDLDEDLQGCLIDTLVRPVLTSILEARFPANPAHPFGCGYCNYAGSCPWGID